MGPVEQRVFLLYCRKHTASLPSKADDLQCIVIPSQRQYHDTLDKGKSMLQWTQWTGTQ